MDAGKMVPAQLADPLDVVPGLGISPRAAREAALKRKAAAEKDALVASMSGLSGAALAVVVSSDVVDFDDLVAAGLPGGERQAELTMLYRGDCSVEFLRESRFTYDALTDPSLPVAVARRVLGSEPSALELSIFCRRKDLTSKELQLAAVMGRVRATSGREAASYISLACVPSGLILLESHKLDAEILGVLRNPNCPEEVVRRYVTHGTAGVRRAALRAIRRRGLAVESSLILAARDLPMTDSTKYPSRDAVRALADSILASR